MRRAMWLWCLGRLLFAQAPPAPDPASLGRVEGRVINAVTGEPLRKTMVTLHGGKAGGGYTAVSDASGHFLVDKVVPGSYNLTAQHQNYALLDYGASRPGLPGKQLSVGAGQSVAYIDLKMMPFGVVAGRVVDQDGDPVTGVSILVMHWGFTRSGRQLLPSGGGASTNDRGEFRVYNLPSGRYYVVARPLSESYMFAESVPGRRATTHAEGLRETFTNTYYPSSQDVASASSVLVNAGQEVPGLDIQLRKVRVYSVQGRLSGIQRGRRYTVSMQPQDAVTSGLGGMGRTASVRQDDGTFVFRGVTVGRYTLVVVAENRVGARQELSIGDGDLEGLVVPLSEPGQVKGRIAMESGTAKSGLRGLRVSLAPVDLIPMNLPNASTADDGSFALEDVPADRYRVTSSQMDGAYLKTIRWSGQVSPDGTVDMPAGGNAILELLFAPTTAVIEGDVKTAEDQPAPGITVLLAPSSRRETDFRMMMADGNGHFTSKGVAPGSYTAIATDASMFGMPDAALLKALEKFTSTVTVEENGHATVSLKVISEATIEAAQ